MKHHHTGPTLRRFRRRSAGYTLVEMAIGTLIASILIGAIMTTYFDGLKAYKAVSNYREIHAGGRKAVDRFAQDMRSVSAITAWTASNLVVTIPFSFDSSGNTTSNKTVTYLYASNQLYRTDSSTGNRDILATNLYSMTISLFDHVGSNTTVLSSAKGIELDLKLRKTVINLIQSEDYLSARLDMRNKH